jgi:hypothetical protein
MPREITLPLRPPRMLSVYHRLLQGWGINPREGRLFQHVLGELATQGLLYTVRGSHPERSFNALANPDDVDNIVAALVMRCDLEGRDADALVPADAAPARRVRARA